MLHYERGIGLVNVVGVGSRIAEAGSKRRVSSAALTLCSVLLFSLFCPILTGARSGKHSSHALYNKNLHSRGMRRLYAGDVKGAVTDFCSMINMRKTPPWTVSVIVLCHEENIARTVHITKGLKPVFVLPVSINGKPCFRVCAGLFTSRRRASAKLKSVSLDGIKNNPFPQIVSCKVVQATKESTNEKAPSAENQAGVKVEKEPTARPGTVVDKEPVKHAGNEVGWKPVKKPVAETTGTQPEKPDVNPATKSGSETVAQKSAVAEKPLKVDVIVPEEKKEPGKQAAVAAARTKTAEDSGNKAEKGKVKPERAPGKNLPSYSPSSIRTDVPSKEGRTWFNKGLAALAKGNVGEAESDFKEALRADPGRPEILNDLGIVRLRQGRYSESEKLFRRALEKSPNYARARLNLSGALWGLGRKDEAVVEAERAVKLDPDDVNGFLTLASFYFALGDTDKAAVAAQRALLLDPGNSRARAIFNKCAEKSTKK